MHYKYKNSMLALKETLKEIKMWNSSGGFNRVFRIILSDGVFYKWILFPNKNRTEIIYYMLKEDIKIDDITQVFDISKE